MSEAPDIWPLIQAQLLAAVGDSTYRLWLEPLELVGVERDELLVAAPDASRSWVSDRYGRVLQACAAAVLGPATTIQLVTPGTGATSPDPGSKAQPPRSAPPAGDLNPRYTFDQFVIGGGNRLAHAAALAVAELPGSAYNPLFIYGPPGVGKTHLLHSIGDYITRYGSGLAVRYTTIEAFTNHFLSALRANALDEFKRTYRHTDVLLIDDVQFLESKAKTEEEFFHTFNALYETGSQIVVTSDRLPRDLAALAERMRDRFEAGLVTDIGAPDHDTRLAILRKRARQDGLPDLDAGVLDVIAGRITDNVRSLEGALIRIVAYASLTGRVLDATLAAEVLDGLYPGTTSPAPVAAKAPSIAEIQAATCDAFGISIDDLLSPNRQAAVAWARQVAMYLAREHTKETLPAIGREFGGRNHTTVMHACRRALERIAADPEARILVAGIADSIRPVDDRRR